MVKFTEYFESMVALKPEWRRAFIDYPRLNELLGAIKQSVRIEMVMSDGSVRVVRSVKQLEEGAAAGGKPSIVVTDLSQRDRGTGSDDDVADADRRNADSRSKNVAGLVKRLTGLGAVGGAGAGGGGGSGSLGAADSARGHRHPSTMGEDDLETLFAREPSMAAGTSEPSATGFTETSGLLSHSQPSSPASPGGAGGSGASASLPIATGASSRPPVTVTSATSLRGFRIPMVAPAAGGHSTSQSMQTFASDASSPVAPSHGTFPPVAFDETARYVSLEPVNGASGTRSSINNSDVPAPPADHPSVGGVYVMNPDFLPPQVLPLSPASGDRTSFNVGGGGEGVQAYLPKISQLGASAAAEFEATLLSEVRKAERFARSSLETFYRYFDTNKKFWLDKNYSRPRAKDSMRYLHSEVSHLCEFIETNELTVKKSLKKYLNSHPFFIRDELSEQHLLPELKQINEETEQLREAISAMWAEIFGEDVTAAKKKIMGRSASPSQSFRAGFFLALIFSTILYWAHVFFELQLSSKAMTRFHHIYPVARLFISIATIYVCWSWTLFHLEKTRINYLYVLELSQKSSMTWMQCLEYGLLMFWIAILAPVIYVRSLHENVNCYKSSGGFPSAAPAFMPICIGLFVLSVIFPIRHVFKRSRRALFRSLWRCAKQPLGGAPKFQDFFVADWGTSLAMPCMDIMYTVCYYTATPIERGHLDSPDWDQCTQIRNQWGYPVAMIPYFWRACHTMKMYRKTKQKAHLINHGKYLSMILAFIVMWWYANSPSPQLMGFVWFVHIGSQIYAYVWDVLMDWGWIRGKDRGTLFKSMTPHLVAMVFDLAARMFFIPAAVSIQPIIGPDNMFIIQACLEIFRRAMWSIFRLENENLNNLETYRTVDFVPHVVLHEE